MAIAAPWVGTTVEGNVAGGTLTSVTVNVSGATNGEVVWIIGVVGNVQPGLIAAPAGWNILGRVAEGTGTSSSQAVIYWKIKASTDTNVTITDATNWTVATRPQFTPISWPGVDTTTPAEGLTWLTRSAGGSTSYVTGTGTPTTATRWAVGVFASRGTTAGVAWTPDPTQTSRAAVINTDTFWLGLLVADSNAAVTAAAHTYTATGQNASHGIGGVFFLIPSAAVVVSGTLTGTLPALTGNVAGAAKVTSTTTGTLPGLTGNVTATARVSATTAGTLPALTGNLTGAAKVSSTTAGTLPAFTGSLAGAVGKVSGTVAGLLPSLTGAMTGVVTAPVSGVLTGVLPALRGHVMMILGARSDLTVTIAPTRFGTNIGPTRGAEAQAGPTRAGIEAEDTRSGTTVELTRRDRG